MITANGGKTVEIVRCPNCGATDTRGVWGDVIDHACPRNAGQMVHCNMTICRCNECEADFRLYVFFCGCSNFAVTEGSE